MTYEERSFDNTDRIRDAFLDNPTYLLDVLSGRAHTLTDYAKRENGVNPAIPVTFEHAVARLTQAGGITEYLDKRDQRKYEGEFHSDWDEERIAEALIRGISEQIRQSYARQIEQKNGTISVIPIPISLVPDYGITSIADDSPSIRSAVDLLDAWMTPSAMLPSALIQFHHTSTSLWVSKFLENHPQDARVITLIKTGQDEGTRPGRLDIYARLLTGATNFGIKPEVFFPEFMLQIRKQHNGPHKGILTILTEHAYSQGEIQMFLDAFKYGLESYATDSAADTLTYNETMKTGLTMLISMIEYLTVRSDLTQEEANLGIKNLREFYKARFDGHFKDLYSDSRKKRKMAQAATNAFLDDSALLTSRIEAYVSDCPVTRMTYDKLRQTGEWYVDPLTRARRSVQSAVYTAVKRPSERAQLEKDQFYISGKLLSMINRKTS